MARLNINGQNRDVQVAADTPLLWVIREQLGLTGTKYGCGVAQCGYCQSGQARCTGCDEFGDRPSMVTMRSVDFTSPTRIEHERTTSPLR